MVEICESWMLPNTQSLICVEYVIYANALDCYTNALASKVSNTTSRTCELKHSNVFFIHMMPCVS